MLKIVRPYRLLALALVLLVAYAWQVEPRLLAVRRQVIRDPVLARTWQGLTIVHLSDLHIVHEGDREVRILKLINEIRPDLILMSGDYRQWGTSPRPAQHFLSQLSAPLGVYGVLGDSDQTQSREECAYCHVGERYAERSSHPFILRNERRTLLWQGRTVTVAGVDPDEAGLAWLKELQLTPSQDQAPLLILSHQSRLWQDTPFAFHSLWLSGDTHGGQIRLPGWFWRVIPYKPDPAHMAGLFSNGAGGWLLVNRGIGQTAWFPFRFGVVPEICVITFAEK